MWKLFGQTIFQSQKQHPQVWHSKNLNYINLLAFGGSINGWALVPCIKYKIQVTAYHGRRTKKNHHPRTLRIWFGYSRKILVQEYFHWPDDMIFKIHKSISTVSSLKWYKKLSLSVIPSAILLKSSILTKIIMKYLSLILQATIILWNTCPIWLRDENGAREKL